MASLLQGLGERDTWKLVAEINRFAAALQCTPHFVQYQPSPAELLLDRVLRYVRRYRRRLVQQPL